MSLFKTLLRNKSFFTRALHNAGRADPLTITLIASRLHSSRPLRYLHVAYEFKSVHLFNVEPAGNAYELNVQPAGTAYEFKSVRLFNVQPAGKRPRLGQDQLVRNHPSQRQGKRGQSDACWVWVVCAE